VFVVHFTPKTSQAGSNYQGHFILNQEDNALLELSIQQPHKSPFLKDTAGEQEVSSTFYISFFKFDDKYYLGRCTFEQNVKKSGSQNVHGMEILSGMFSQQQPQYMSQAQRAVLYSEMLNPIVHYDSNFWSTFKMAESAILQDVINQSSDLLLQFEENKDQRLLPLPPGIQNYEQMVDEQNFLDFFMQY
jgi:hypothetical protein